uniref:Aminotransferase class I/classII large domain-containing protein n=1 Tax=Aureoumbra lagunensis TaxID=44058 RepID=A0A7S3K078_9STRA
MLGKYGRRFGGRLRRELSIVPPQFIEHPFEADPTLADRPTISSPLASLRMAKTEPSVFAEFSELSEKYHAVNLGQGYPDFAMPEFVKEAATEAIFGNYNQYSRPGGHTRLVRTLAARYTPKFGKNLNATDEIAVVGGATNAIFSAVVALVDPSDEVVCVEPFFDAPKIAADLMGAKTIGVPLRADWAKTSADWKLDLNELEAAITSRTKLLVLNTPHNPTGKVFTIDELDGIADIVQRHPGLVVLSDEVYEAMVYDDLEHIHFASRPGMFERTLTVFSAGKTFSATGWRVGYVIGPSQFVQPLVRVHQASNFSTPTPLQVAIAIAFERCDEFNYLENLKLTLQAKRDKLCRLLRVAGLAPIVPQGGYFLLADTTKIAANTPFPLWEAPEDIPLRDRRDFAVCRLLCERAGVTAIPASAFFSQGHRHITGTLFFLL